MKTLAWNGDRIRKYAMVLRDRWGPNYDAELWGDPYTNHHCLGEPFTIGVLRVLAVRPAWRTTSRTKT